MAHAGERTVILGDERYTAVPTSGTLQIYDEDGDHVISFPEEVSDRVVRCVIVAIKNAVRETFARCQGAKP